MDLCICSRWKIQEREIEREWIRVKKRSESICLRKMYKQKKLEKTNSREKKYLNIFSELIFWLDSFYYSFTSCGFSCILLRVPPRHTWNQNVDTKENMTNIRREKKMVRKKLLLLFVGFMENVWKMSKKNLWITLIALIEFPCAKCNSQCERTVNDYLIIIKLTAPSPFTRMMWRSHCHWFSHWMTPDYSH